MSYNTVVSITITFTIAKKRKPFSKDMKYQNGWFGKECLVKEGPFNTINILMDYYSTTSKFMAWGEHVFKVPEEFDFLKCYIYIVYLYLEEILVNAFVCFYTSCVIVREKVHSHNPTMVPMVNTNIYHLMYYAYLQCLISSTSVAPCS